MPWIQAYKLRIEKHKPQKRKAKYNWQYVFSAICASRMCWDTAVACGLKSLTLKDFYRYCAGLSACTFLLPALLFTFPLIYDQYVFFLLTMVWFILLTILRRWSRCWSYSLLLCGLSYEAICFKSWSLGLCYFVLGFFSPFSIAITSLGEERANRSAFRTFVRFALVWFCLFPLPLRVWEGCGLWVWHSLEVSLNMFEIWESCTYKRAILYNI